MYFWGQNKPSKKNLAGSIVQNLKCDFHRVKASWKNFIAISILRKKIQIGNVQIYTNIKILAEILST